MYESRLYWIYKDDHVAARKNTSDAARDFAVDLSHKYPAAEIKVRCVRMIEEELYTIEPTLEKDNAGHRKLAQG